MTIFTVIQDKVLWYAPCARLDLVNTYQVQFRETAVSNARSFQNYVQR